VVGVRFVGCEVDFAEELLLVVLEFADHCGENWWRLCRVEGRTDWV
jgi:hypothetical protein